MSLLLLGRTDETNKLFSNRHGIADKNRPEKLKEILANCGLDHVIISNVFLSGITDQEFIGNLVLELEEIFDEMQAVVYLQHQSRDFPLLINQRVKSGMASWEKIHQIPTELYEYDELCRRWDQDVDLVVRDFGRCEDTVVDDFCGIADLDPPPAKFKSPLGEVFDDVALRLMVQINSSAHPARAHIRRRIAKDLEQMKLSDRAPELTDDLVATLQQKFADGNSWVSENYLNGVPLLA